MSTVNDSGTPEAALMGFALTQANEVVFDTLSTSRKAVNLANNPPWRWLLAGTVTFLFRSRA